MDTERSVAIACQWRDQASAGAAATAGSIQSSLSMMSGAANSTQATMGLLLTSTLNTMGTGGGEGGGILGAVKSAVSGVGQQLSDMVTHFRWASLFVGTMAAGIAGSFIQMAGSLEQLRVGFTTLLKDDAKVQDALNFIQQWALETPFSVNDAADSFKRFLAITGDLDKTKLMMTSLGDAVVATGGNINEFNFAARGLTQMMSMSKVRAQEMYQLVNANIPAFDIMAKAIQDGTLKVEGLTTATTNSTGPTKAMTSAWKSATDENRYLGDQIKITEERIKTATSAKKVNQATVDSLNLTLKKEKDNLAENNVAINTYTNATKSASAAVDVQTMSLTEIKGKLQDIGNLNISGAEAAKLFTDYFAKAYGGAAKAQTTTLIGELGVLKDQFVFGAAALIGYNKVTGETYGLYAKIKDALGVLGEFLKNAQDKFEGLGRILGSNTALFAILGTAIGIMSGFVGGILAPVLGLGLIFGGAAVAIGTFTENLLGLNNLAKPTVDTIGSLTTEYKKQQTAGLELIDSSGKLSVKFNDLAPKANDVVRAYIDMDGILRPINQSYKDMNQFTGETLTRYENLGKKIDEVNKTQLTPLETVVANLKTDFKTLIDMLGALGDTFTDTKTKSDGTIANMQMLEKTVQGVIVIFSTLFFFVGAGILFFRRLGDEVQRLWGIFSGSKAVVDDANKDIEGLEARMTNLIRSEGASIDQLMGGILSWQPAATAMNVKVVNDWSTMSSRVMDMNTGMYTSINTTFPQMSSVVATQSANMATSVNTHLSTMPISATTNAGGMMSNFKTAVDTGKPDVEKAVASLTSSVDSNMATMAKGATGHGNDLIQNLIDGMKSKLKEMKANPIGNLLLQMSPLQGILPFLQHGGIVPGPAGAPVPIIAHGGELVTPQGGGSGGSQQSNININFSGTYVLDSPDRVNDLAKRISAILGRQMELSYLGAGW